MKKINITFFFLLFASQLLFSNVFSSYKKVSVIKTQYFDIIFPQEAQQTAEIIINKADFLFESACQNFQLEKKFRMPVVITKDSADFYTEYTPAPYNRIIVYDGIPSWNNTHKDKIIHSFNTAIIKAVASSKKDKFWQFISSFTANDAIQPTALLNIPTNFMNGVSETFANSMETNGNKLITDTFALQLLSQAKADNTFPTWIDTTGAADIFPNEKISQIAMTAFVAYIQQQWGIEKFIEFWEQSGKVNFFYITAGIFKKVYNISITEAWNNFKETIPVYSQELGGSVLFTEDYQNQYKYIQATPYGIVFYDEIKNQIIIIQNNKKKILFVATNIQNLAISPSGNYLAVSYKANKTQKDLSQNKVKVYNLAEQAWIEKTHKITNGSFIVTKDEMLTLVGITSVENKFYIKGYTLYNNKDEVFSYKIQGDYIPQNIICTKPGEFFYSVQEENETIFTFVDTQTETTTTYTFPYNTKNFKAAKITINSLNQDSSEEVPNTKKVITFTYAPKELGMPSKMGYFSFDNPEKIYLQTNTFSGGVNDSTIYENSVIFYSQRTNFQELRQINFAELNFSQEELVKTIIHQQNQESKANITSLETTKYNPLHYIFKGTTIPFFPISSLDFYGYQTSPGLGFTYLTSTDPLEQISGALSFCAGFANPEENYTKFQKEFTISAYGTTTIFPIELSAGGIWYFDKDGKYKLQVLTGGRYRVPIGMSYQNLTFSLQQLWDCSTSYTDIETGISTNLDNWPKIYDAFNKLSFSISAAYNNYHQSGISPYQQLGFETNASFVTIFDFHKIKTTQSLKWNEPSQLKFTVDLGFKLPYLIPVFGVENWTICFPLKVFTQWYGEEGTYCHSFAEILLAGYEIQKGIPGVNLYLQRFGIKLGYDISFEYEHLNIANPDIRNITKLFEGLTSSQIDDFIYFNFQLDLSPVVGKATSSFNVTAGVQFEFHLQKNESKITALIKTNL